MTVRFAAARSIARSPVARVFARRDIANAANDNGESHGALDLSGLEPALRHFAEHGLGAAAVAHSAARRAIDNGAMDEFEHWLGLCRIFDRRMAARLERNVAPPIGEAIEAASEVRQR